eukprot:TRINITY_DN613_c0_g1_i2.p1 TRINITY_DN613_c0_g1~~TRINITY_DN613_c0_g1_i2.p1  ORF type:complete len:164 (+),score=37.38 TRINITY_DN613_c0_g1_i2:44-535(+)
MAETEKENKSAEEEKEREALKWQNLIPIAKPLASKKLNKKVLKIVKKAAKTKQLRRGVKEVVKALRKGQKGLCVIAGDISPLDVITHVPILCEEAHVPYIYTPSREDLGSAAMTKRPTSCMLILRKSLKGGVELEDEKKFFEEYDEAVTEVENLAKKFLSWDL